MTTKVRATEFDNFNLKAAIERANEILSLCRNTLNMGHEDILGLAQTMVNRNDTYERLSWQMVKLESYNAHCREKGHVDIPADQEIQNGGLPF